MVLSSGKQPKESHQDTSSSLAEISTSFDNISLTSETLRELGSSLQVSGRYGSWSASYVVDSSGQDSCCGGGKKRFSLIAFCLSNFCAGTFYSLMGPFFPNEAQAKDISSTTTGLIFGVYPLVYILVSPLVGRYLVQIGGKFAFVAGVFVVGACGILFGLLEWVKDGTTFATMCFAVRVVQAIGGASLNTASFAMVATMFPHRLATMFGILEVFTGLGTMVGPPIGGWMYEFGGFSMPFIISGALIFVLGVLCLAILPSPVNQTGSERRRNWVLLVAPLVLIVGVVGATGTAAIGFLDVAFSIRLAKRFNLSAGYTGLVFVLGPAAYVVSAPVWGRVADWKPSCAPFFMATGTVIGGFAFWIMGPSPFLGIPDTLLWAVMVSYAVMGLCLGTHVVNAKIMTTEARHKGLSKSLETMGIISGIISAFNSLGSFVGPLLGGYLNDRFDFPGASAAVGTILMFMGLVLLVFSGVRACCNSRRTSAAIVDERTALLLPDDSSSSGPTRTSYSAGGSIEGRFSTKSHSPDKPSPKAPLSVLRHSNSTPTISSSSPGQEDNKAFGRRTLLSS